MRKKSRKTRQASPVETVPNDSSQNSATPRSSTGKRTAEGPKRTVEVDFHELPDGRLLEMIEDPHDATKSVLAIWKNGQIRYAKKVKCGNQVFVPVPKDAGIIRHVSLANGAESYGSVGDLRSGVMAAFLLTLELSQEQLCLLSSLVLSSWIVEKLPVAPYVAFVGPPGSGKTTALRMLNLLCRRSLLTADISSAAFYETCNRLTPTLLIDEVATVDNHRNLFHLLRAGTTQDFVAIRKDNAYRTYGVRAVSWLELPDDAALNSRCLIIHMKSCTRTDLLTPIDPKILRGVEILKRRLLQFRLANFKTLALPKVSAEEELQPRTRDLFRALALPLGECPEHCETLLRILRSQESLREVLSVLQSAVLNVLYDVIHSYPELNAISIVELTERVNATLRQQGEPGKISEKKLSEILTSLQLTNRTRKNVGYVLWFDRKTREEIHSQARTYRMQGGVTREQSARCEICRFTSEFQKVSSSTKLIEGSKRVGRKGSRERGEHGERRKGRVKRKPAR